VILFAYAIVILAVIWIAIPIPSLAGIFSTLLSALSSGLNYIIEGVASWRWSAVELSIPEWAVWTIYAVAIAITILLNNIKPKKTVNLPL
jgi:hypothetical protein